MADVENKTPLSPLHNAWKVGRRAAWENRFTGLGLWVFGTAIVFGYFQIDIVRETLESIGQLKQRTGWIFGIVSTAIFGGLLPVVIPYLVSAIAKPKSTRRESEAHSGESRTSVDQTAGQMGSTLVSSVLFWGFKGFEVDVLYRLQSWMFGDAVDIPTIGAKVFVDMAIYAPLFGLLNCVLFYVWRDNGYSFARAKASLGKNWYVNKVLPALISNACVWLPSVILIYSLPLALQLPVQNLILCFWVLVLVFFTRDETTNPT